MSDFESQHGGDELAHAKAEFLQWAADGGEPATEFTVVATEFHPGGRLRGWRFDVNVAFASRSFLLTETGLWCSAVRTGLASFGWGVYGGSQLSDALEEWKSELLRALRTRAIYH